MKQLQKIFSDPLVKFTYGLILSMLIMSPYINKFSTNPLWLVSGSLFFIVAMLSIKFKKDLNLIGIAILVLFTIAITAFIYFTYE